MGNKKTTEEEFQREIRKIHDEIKTHPFWINPTPDGMRDVAKRFLSAEDLIFSQNHYSFSENFKAFQDIVRKIDHNFNREIFGTWWGEDKKYVDFDSFRRSSDFGSLVLMEQRFLSLIHSYIDGENFETFRGYTFDPSLCYVARRMSQSPIDSTGYKWSYRVGDVCVLPMIKRSLVKKWENELKDGIKRNEHDEWWKNIYSAALRSLKAEDGRYCIVID